MIDSLWLSTVLVIFILCVCGITWAAFRDYLGFASAVIAFVILACATLMFAGVADHNCWGYVKSEQQICQSEHGR